MTNMYIPSSLTVYQATRSNTAEDFSLQLTFLLFGSFFPCKCMRVFILRHWVKFAKIYLYIIFFCKVTNRSTITINLWITALLHFRHYHVIFRELVFITSPRWHDSVETCSSVIIYKLIVIVLCWLFYKIIKMYGTCIKIKNL